MNKKKKAFSLVEVLIGMFIMAIVLLSFFAINQSSSAQSMDAYYEFLGQTLGSEVVEFCRGMGYEWADKYMSAEKPDLFPLNKWHDILDPAIFPVSSYFGECTSFERYVSMKRAESQTRSILVTVEIRVKSGNKANIWLSRGNMAFSVMLLERPIR